VSDDVRQRVERYVANNPDATVVDVLGALTLPPNTAILSPGFLVNVKRTNLSRRPRSPPTITPTSRYQILDSRIPNPPTATGRRTEGAASRLAYRRTTK